MCIRDRDDRINTINETVINKVQNQIETQSKEIENRCLTTVNEQLESRTKCEVNKQIEIKTNILQDKLEKFELNVVNITKNIETIDNTISEYESNNNSRINVIQSKIREIDDLNMQTNSEIYNKCTLIENNLMNVKN